MKSVIRVERECSWRQPDVLEVSIKSVLIFEQQAKQDTSSSWRQPISSLQGIAIQKAVFFTVTVVRASI
jgi:hypothetical protein